MQYKKLFEPTNIGKVELKNRFSLAPMGPLGLGDDQGGFSQKGIEYYVERAKGGTGLLFTGLTFPDNEVEKHLMSSRRPCPTYNPLHFVRTAKEMLERVHAYDCKMFLQMSAGFGRVFISKNLGDFPPVAPSSIKHKWSDQICREITIEEIKSMVKNFGDGAYNAKRAGFDGIEIHAVHEGYLLDQFAMSLFNKRTDKYGGTLENRLRFTREIVEEIKKRCGEDYPVVLRYSVKSFIKSLTEGGLPNEEFKEVGRDIEEGIEAAKLLVQYGYDALDVDVGSYEAPWCAHPPMYIEKGLYIDYAKIMKENVNVPIICAGRMDDPNIALKAVENNACDIVSLGRPLLADPHYVNKLRKGEIDDIRPCISCQEGCIGRVQEYAAINCAVNPMACRESTTKLNPITKSKKVMIIGGGIAGCEVARVLAMRGHKPEIFEMSDRLGGNLIAAGVPDFKEDDIKLIKWFEYQIKKLDIPVHLNAKVEKEDVLAKDFDTVVVATGSTAKKLNFSDNENVYTAKEVLLKGNVNGEKIAVIGGGLVGCETALWLKDMGKETFIVEALDDILAVNAPLAKGNFGMLKRLIPYNNIETYTSTFVKNFENGELTLIKDNKEIKIGCDTVVICIGFEENRDLYKSLQYEVSEIFLVGDARKVSNVMYGIWDGFEIANSI